MLFFQRNRFSKTGGKGKKSVLNTRKTVKNLHFTEIIPKFAADKLHEDHLSRCLSYLKRGDW
jgi:hypothetical protein